jgi:serine/threonine protein phosphatase PrpC
LLAEHGKTEGGCPVAKWALCNRRGVAAEKKDKVNQDAYILIEHFMMRDRYLFGVCDGHGVNGHFVSDFVKEILPENIEYFFIKHKALKKGPRNVVENALKDAFLKTARDLEESGIDVNFSGSTACLLYLHQHSLYCANLGDSRAVIFSRAGEKWQCRPLSFDHKA